MSRGLTLQGFGFGLNLSPGSYSIAGQPISFSGTYDGALAINSSGLIVNGHGIPLQLRGSNVTGMYYGYISGIGGIDPWGNPSTPGDPNWVAMKNWKVGSVRIPINVQSFLGLQYQLLTGTSNAGGTWGGTNYNADLGGDTRLIIQNAIVNARLSGMYPIIDAHVSAPQFTFASSTQYLASANQPPAMDYQTYSVFWGTGATSFLYWLAVTFGSAAFNTANGFNGGAAGSQYNASYGGSSGFADIIFELGNEFYLSNYAFTLTTIAGSFGNPAWKANNSGSNYTTTNGGTAPDTPGHASLGAYVSGQEFVSLYGGYANLYTQQSQAPFNGRGIPNGFTASGVGNAISQSWQIYGTQAAVTSIRAGGFGNVIIFPVNGFSTIMSNIQYSTPVDTLSPPQLAVQYHAYQSGSSGYPSTLDPGSGTVACLAYPNAIAAGTSGLGYAMPVFLDEIGTQSGSTLSASDAYIARMQGVADAATKGSFHFLDYSFNGPLAYGSTTTQSYSDGILTAPITVTAGISNGSGGAGYILNVTVGSGITAGMCVSSGATTGYPAIMPFGMNGTTGSGGPGTYWLSGSSQLVGSTSMSLNGVAANNGQGTTMNTWLVNHA